MNMEGEDDDDQDDDQDDDEDGRIKKDNKLNQEHCESYFLSLKKQQPKNKTKQKTKNKTKQNKNVLP